MDAQHLAADAKSMRLEPVFDASVAIVSGDPDRLQQVVTSLNAIKFTQEAEG